MSGLVDGRVGSRISDRYVVIGLLGEGDAGEVHRVLDEHLNGEVAIKLFFPKSGVSATWDEARVLARLQSQYLLPVHNADVIAGTDIRYITTPVMADDLENACRPHGVDAAQAARWGQQLAYGLQRMHEEGLLHRDVKPGNAYLDAHDDVLLGDLGMAVQMDEKGCAGADGTLATVAPEVLQSDTCSVASDIYSLAATLFYMVSGRYPNGSLSLDKRSRRDRIIAGEFDKLRDVAPHISQSFGQIIDRALSTDPALRPQSAQAFANELASSHHHRRSWRQIPAHGGHDSCFEGGETTTAKAVTVCVTSQPKGRLAIEVLRASGGHVRAHEHENLTRNRALTTLRALFRDL
ncbi:serine/threonine-protein kinase [Streptomyces sp. NPDC051976]|uniref:serine/threonine-protein kinase n=1 Tax=Streptomyces sp. NPDC051976 TaxID=3154947 RepID=UPI00343BA5EC